tara:strand:+ start:519 stop:677 length:159 start_codon:yes stop_codon:yes gene_type:complete
MQLRDYVEELKNPNWKNTSHSKLTFDFKTMTLSEDLYSNSNPKKYTKPMNTT